MNKLRVLLYRIFGLFSRKGLERDLEDEVQFHLQAEIEEGLRRGLTPGEARAAALRSFGGVARTKEIYRETRGLPAVEIALQDLRYTFRVLRRSPGFTAAAVLSLALGIGANTAIFSLLNAIVLRMLPVPDPQQLVQFTYIGPNDWNSYFGYPQLERFQARTRTMSGVFGRNWLGRVDLMLRGASGLAQCEAMTGNAFSVLGMTPQFGRLFSAGDDRPDASVAVLSDRYWRNRLGADPSVVGSTVAINQLPFTVIGIAPPGFAAIQFT